MLFVCFLLVSSPYVSLMLSVLKNILRVSPIKGVIYEKDRVRNKHHPGQEILTGYYWFLCVLSEEHSLFPLNVSTLLLVTKKKLPTGFFFGVVQEPELTGQWAPGLPDVYDNDPPRSSSSEKS